MNHGITLPVTAASPDYPVVGASGNRVEWGARPVICVTGSKFVLKNPVTLKKAPACSRKMPDYPAQRTLRLTPLPKINL